MPTAVCGSPPVFGKEKKLADGKALRGEDFYLGELDDDGAFVLQLWRDKPVALTQNEL